MLDPDLLHRRATTGVPAALRGYVEALRAECTRLEGAREETTTVAAIPGWKQPLARRLDELIVRTVPGVQKAVKWNSPFYGLDGQSWFLSFHCFTKYIKVTFFRGTSLSPVPPGESKHKEVRYLDIREGQLDADQFVDWVKQASRLPGERL